MPVTDKAAQEISKAMWRWLTGLNNPYGVILAPGRYLAIRSEKEIVAAGASPGEALEAAKKVRGAKVQVLLQRVPLHPGTEPEERQDAKATR